MTRPAESYIYHAEGRADGRPLVFAFHGTGGTENQLVPLVRELVPGAQIIAPRGDVSEHGALRFFRRRSEGDYDMEDLAGRTQRMSRFLRAHVEKATPAEVIGLGYSNGANMLASVMFEEPGLFDRAVLMHPLIPWTPAPARQEAQILITAGEHDPICPPDRTKALARWFEDQGARVETSWHAGGHEIDRSEVAAVAQFLRAGGAETGSGRGEKTDV